MRGQSGSRTLASGVMPPDGGAIARHAPKDDERKTVPAPENIVLLAGTVEGGTSVAEVVQGKLEGDLLATSLK